MAMRGRVLAGCIPAILISGQWLSKANACREGWTYPNGRLIEDEQPGFLQVSGVQKP
jgi:hypothetical protein